MRIKELDKIIRTILNPKVYYSVYYDTNTPKVLTIIINFKWWVLLLRMDKQVVKELTTFVDEIKPKGTTIHIKSI